MVTETSDGDGLMNIKELADAADAGLQSWNGWEWKSFCRESTHQTGQLGTWGAFKTGYGPEWNGQGPDATFQAENARTYASAVAGEIATMHFDTFTGAFALEHD